MVINNDKNIFDVALEVYGDISYAIKLVNDNTINLSTNDITGLNLTFDETIKETKVIPPIKPNNTKSIFTTDGQSIFDVAILTSGSMDSIFDLIQSNNITDINSTVTPNLQFTFSTENNNLTKYFHLKDIVLNTSNPKYKKGKAFSIGFSLGLS